MRPLWANIALAFGLGVLYASSSATFGFETASVALAAITISYATLNVLLGHPKDAPDAAHLITAALATTRVTYFAIGVVWAASAATVIIPIANRALTAEFAVTVTDEERKQIGDARVYAEASGKAYKVIPRDGVFVVRYSRVFTPAAMTIRIEHAGLEREVTHRQYDGIYKNVAIPVWSGRTAVGVTHLSVDGVAIDMFLRGDLPDELARFFPRVSVLRNDVFKYTKELLALYPPLGPISRIDYQRDEFASDRSPRRLSASAVIGDTEGYEWLRRYGAKLDNVAAPDILLGEFPLDFTSDLLGASAAMVLPPGFAARFHLADEWYNGNEVVPSPNTDAWLTETFGPVARGPNGAVSMRLERLITASDMQYALTHQRPRNRGEWPEDRAAAAIMRRLITLGVPPGFVAGAVHLQWADGCAYVQPHLAVYLPEPKLRFTILQNLTSGPIHVDQLILSTQSRSSLQRIGAEALSREVSYPLDTLAPGEAILVPRELTFESMYSDAEVQEFLLPHSPAAATFHVLAVSSELDPVPGEPMPPPISGPSSLFLAPEQVRPGRPRALSEPLGVPYLMGPSVAHVDYVINGVRLRTRSDSRSAVRMLGSYEAGSCPFVFVQLSRGTALVNLGHILTTRIGSEAEGVDRLRLPDQFVSLELRELEEEVTYVDQAILLVLRGTKLHKFSARGKLAANDGVYVVLRKGETLPLDFGYDPQPEDRALQLEVTGYYEPLLPPAFHRTTPENRRDRQYALRTSVEAQ